MSRHCQEPQGISQAQASQATLSSQALLLHAILGQSAPPPHTAGRAGHSAGPQRRKPAQEADQKLEQDQRTMGVALHAK